MSEREEMLADDLYDAYDAELVAACTRAGNLIGAGSETLPEIKDPSTI